MDFQSEDNMSVVDETKYNCHKSVRVFWMNYILNEVMAYML